MNDMIKMPKNITAKRRGFSYGVDDFSVLGIACVAMLSAVGANSRNSTDVLSETKAYYAAESGLQATINVCAVILTRPQPIQLTILII
jgi:hypothetical protein